jgi:hypothetical protein
VAKLIIGSMEFANREEAKGYLRKKVENYELGKPVPDTDASLWSEVILKHEWFDEYVTHGIDYFSAARSEQRPNLRNMVVVNGQGEQKPFSYQKYLSGAPLSKLAKVKAALRTEVDQQITDYRTKRFSVGSMVPCAVSGKPLTERRCHVHHSVKPFLQIVDEFLCLNRDRWDDMETEASGATGYRLIDRIIAADWMDFHRTHATLEIVSAEENLKAGASGYRMSFKAP